jgi:hypothetical protein
VIATIALLRERRQSRHAGAATRVTVAQLRAGGVAGRIPAGAAVGSSPTGGSHSLGSPGPVGGSGPFGGSADAMPRPAAFVSPAAFGGPAGAPDPSVYPDAPDLPGDNPDATSRIAMSGFPGPAAHPFRASEIAARDDLFTHRGHEAPDR